MRALFLIVVLCFPSVCSAQAVWNNRSYSQPICNNPRCQMCWGPNGIDAQLKAQKSFAAPLVASIDLEVVPAVDRLRVTELAPTPMEAVMAMLVVANPKPHEVVYDLGCGDGRVLALAAGGFGCRAVGIELNPDSYQLATERIKHRGLGDRVRIYQGDVLNYTYAQADVVTVYLYPELIERIIPRLQRGTRVVSYLHPIPGGELVIQDGFEFYVLTVK